MWHKDRGPIPSTRYLDLDHSEVARGSKRALTGSQSTTASIIHDLHLSGPGVDKKTSVSGTGRRIWIVTLQRGKTYRFMCDPHASIMKGSFKTF